MCMLLPFRRANENAKDTVTFANADALAGLSLCCTIANTIRQPSENKPGQTLHQNHIMAGPNHPQIRLAYTSMEFNLYPPRLPRWPFTNLTGVCFELHS